MTGDSSGQSVVFFLTVQEFFSVVLGEFVVSKKICLSCVKPVDSIFTSIAFLWKSSLIFANIFPVRSSSNQHNKPVEVFIVVEYVVW